MKKLLTIAILVLAAATMAHGQGSQNVKSTYGSGAPGNSTPCSKIGDEYTDISAGIQYVATAITQSATVTSCTWTANGGGITSVSSLPATCTPGTTAPVTLSVPPYGIYYCPQTNTWAIAATIPTTIVAASYGVVADVIHAFDATFSSGVNPVPVTLSVNDAPFTADRVGKASFCTGAGGAVMVPLGTILSVTSGTLATFSGTSTGAATGTGSCAWGTDDTNAWQAAATAFTAFPNCGTFQLPAGMSFTSKGFLNLQPARCKQGPSFAGQTSGWTIAGQGFNVSVIVPLPGFNFATTSASGMFFADAVSAGLWMHDFSINFMGNAFSGISASPATNVLFLPGDSYLQNVGIENGMYATSTALTAFSVIGQGDDIRNLQVDSAGKNLGVFCNGPDITIEASFTGDMVSAADGFSVGASGICYGFGNRWDGGAAANQITVSGTYASYGGEYNGIPLSGGVSIRLTGGTVILHDFQPFSVSRTATSYGIFCGAANGVAILENSHIYGGTTNGSINTSANACKVIDEGGNSLSGPIVNTAPNLTWQSTSNPLSGACTGVVTSAATVGLYPLGQQTTRACTSTTVDLGKVMQQAGTVLALYCSATAGNQAADACTVVKNGAAQTMTCSLNAVASCTDGATAHQVAYVAGDVLGIEAVAGTGTTLANVKGTLVAP